MQSCGKGMLESRHARPGRAERGERAGGRGSPGTGGESAPLTQPWGGGGAQVQAQAGVRVWHRTDARASVQSFSFLCKAGRKVRADGEECATRTSKRRAPCPALV